MRRLSIQLTCLLALTPALGLGCSAQMEAPVDRGAGSDYVSAESPDYDGEAKSESAVASAAPGGAGYGYAEDLAGGAVGDPSTGAEMADASASAPAPAAVPSGGRRSRVGKDKSAGSSAKKIAKSEGRPAEIAVDGDSAKIVRDDRFDKRNIQSGTLTAGSFDDNLNPWVFDTFVDQVRTHPDLSALASAFAGQRTVLRVQDSGGRPVANAKVEIDGKLLTTRSDGRVVYVKGWDSGRQGRGKAKVQHGNAQTTVRISDKAEQVITLEGANSHMPTQLDIALVIDATGSMGDELEYLKVEIRDISEAIDRHFPGVDQRFALVVYRDKGDQYESRSFDFTGDLDQFQADLADQTANGGGDYPEAMDAGLEAAAGLSWRGGDTARVTFLVADAPPHSNKVDDTLEAVDDLRAKGVAIYPVASSGVAGEAEFVMRAAAMLTGAQYLFLTDDSGVGNSHAEPHIPCYTVEQLAPLMIRTVRSELSGHRVESEPKYAIRSVGQGQAGVCAKPRSTAKIAR